MDWLNFFEFCFFAPLVLFCFGVVGWIVSLFNDNKKVGDICKCLMAWLTLFFCFPRLARKAGFVKNKLVGWLIALFAPPLLVFYALIYGLSTMDDPLPYDKLPYTSRGEIAAITEIPNFPEFEYIDNSYDGWLGMVTCINYHFKSEDDALNLLQELKRRCGDKENIYWAKDTLSTTEDKEFFGCTEVYVYHRGWDSLYVTRPPKVADYEAQVKIIIGKKGFIVKPEPTGSFWLEDHVTPDKLYKITGVKFPDYEVVNYIFYYGREYSCDAVIKLKHFPSKTFLKAIEKAKHWEKEKNGTYTFGLDNVDASLGICVNPKSKIITISYSTY